jgi:hypothetical protein
MLSEKIIVLTINETTFSYSLKVVFSVRKYPAKYTVRRSDLLLLPEMKLHCLVPNFHFSIHICERFIYSHDRSFYFLQQKRRADRQKTHKNMNVEIVNEAAHFHFWVYLFQIFRYSVCAVHKQIVRLLPPLEGDIIQLDSLTISNN